MLPLAMKTKAAFVLITAAIASAGAVTGVMLTRHSSSGNIAQATDVPLPTAPPMASPGTINPDNAQAFSTSSAVAGNTYQPVPAPAPTPVIQPQPAPAGSPVVQAQYVPTPTPAPAVAQQQYQAAPQYYPALSPEQLDQLLGPIALYPDPLIAEMLPASTYPDQLASAALFLRSNPTPPDYVLQSQPWEDPVKSLAHTPSVLVWMYNNPEWTRTLGTAVTYQQPDVMASIQRLRQMALNAGSLYNTPQQLVLSQGNYLCIEPATPDVVYVPVYDWRTCYVRRYEPTFFVGARIGGWFDADCDWDDRFITFGARWDRGWDHRWDDDRNARQVIVRDARNNDRDRRPDGGRTNNTTIVNNNTTVRVGGTPWRRNDARPAPTFPTSVRPARPQATPTTPRIDPNDRRNSPADRRDQSIIRDNTPTRDVTPSRDATPNRDVPARDGNPRDGRNPNPRDGRDGTPNQRVVTPTPTPTPPHIDATPTPPAREPRAVPSGRDGRGAIPATPAIPEGRGATPAIPATPPKPDRTPDINPGRGDQGRDANPTPAARGNDGNPGRGSPGRGNDNNDKDKNR